MKQRSQRHYSLDEYFAIEQGSEIKHEYYDGAIFAMAGASLNHNRIVSNVLDILRNVLRNTNCETFASDLRVYTSAGLYTYPDAMVISGPVQLIPAPLDTVSNPCLIVEVLSDSTADYDREDKFHILQVD